MLILQVPSSVPALNPHLFVPDKKRLQPDGLSRTRHGWIRVAPFVQKFPTAASRRSLDRVSVPVWLVVLSDQLLIVALVGLYPANQLISHRPLRSRQALRSPAFTLRSYAVLATLSGGCPPTNGHVPMYYSPVRHSPSESKLSMLPFDLHV